MSRKKSANSSLLADSEAQTGVFVAANPLHRAQASAFAS